MINIKAVILPSDEKDGGNCNVKIQIIKDRTIARIKTSVWTHKDNFKNGLITSGDGNFKLKNVIVSEDFNKYERLILENENELNQLSAPAIKEFLIRGKSSVITDFFKFTEIRIAELTKYGKMGTVMPLTNMLRVAKEYHSKPTLSFSEITVRFLEGFESHYLKEGHKVNSVAVYMRYIRSMFNTAMDEYNINTAKPVITNYPFRKFKIQTAETANRNLDVKFMRLIRDLKTINKREEITNDIFTLQMYMTAPNIKDLYWLPVSSGDRIQFSRFKTGRFHNIKIESEAFEIIEKYKGSKYLLCFADMAKKNRMNKETKPHARIKDLAWSDSGTFNKMLNETLQKIQKRLNWDLQGDLTTYYARHSVASIMREIGISKDDISLCLGHLPVEKNLKTTGGYIKEDFEKIDLANRELIDFINSDIKDGKGWKEFKAQKNPLQTNEAGT